MSAERLSEEAATRLFDRMLIAEAEVKSLRKALQAKSNEIDALKKEPDKIKTQSVSDAMLALERVADAFDWDRNWSSFSVENLISGHPQYQKRMDLFVRNVRKAIEDVRSAKPTDEQKAKWHNIGVLEGAAISLCYLNEAKNGRRSEENINKVVEVIRASSPENVDKAESVRAALVRLADAYGKRKKTKK